MTMRKLLTKVAATFSLLLLAAGLAAAQTALTQTSLAAAQTAGTAGSASGITGSFQTTVSVSSATGIQTAVNGQPITILYIDQEAEAVMSLVTGQTTVYNVLRGQFGTKASPHASGAMVLLQVISPQFGGFSGSGGLQLSDPPVNGNCTAANTAVTPWVNMTTSAQWLCSTVTSTWVPGWNNPLAESSSVPTAAVASAAGQITPSGPLFHVTGALAVTGFLIPVGFNKGCFTVINDGAWTWTAANNIAIASAAGQVVSMTNQFCYDSNSAKFYPAHQ